MLGIFYRLTQSSIGRRRNTSKCLRQMQVRLSIKNGLPVKDCSRREECPGYGGSIHKIKGHFLLL